MFTRKPKAPKPIDPIIPEIPKFISREARLLEMLEADRREHEGNIRICADLIAMRDRLEKSRESMLDMAAHCAAEIDFAAKQIANMIGCLQGDTTDLPAVISANPLPNGAAEPAQDEPRAIGFLPR
jgi:hypothetical protein